MKPPNQPAPTFQVGGSSSSSEPRVGQTVRRKKALAGQSHSQRVRVAEGQGENRQGNEVEELERVAQEDLCDGVAMHSLEVMQQIRLVNRCRQKNGPWVV